MNSLARLTSILAQVALWAAGAGLTLMTAFIAAQVFWRYLLNSSLIWSEPASVMIMGWFIFLGAAVGIREGYHLSFDIILYMLPERGKKILHSLSDAVVAAFGCGMIYYGSELALKTMNNRVPSLGISGAWDFIPIVAGGVLVVLFSVERIFRRAAGLSTARFGETELED